MPQLMTLKGCPFGRALETRQIIESLVMSDFVCDNRNIRENSLLDRERVKVLENQWYMFMFPGQTGEMSGSIWDTMQLGRIGSKVVMLGQSCSR